jgi:chromosome partitioning protein
MDAWALAESLELVEKARVLRPELAAAVMLTKKVARTAMSAGARRALTDCGLPVLATELGYRVTYAEAPAAGRGVTDYAPSSQAAAEVRALVDELEALAGLKEEPAHAVA